jgi:septal ring factor EnvC (AmiA/AmiB activator)
VRQTLTFCLCFPDDVFKIVANESSLQDKIKQLEGELAVFKKAYTESSSEKTLLEQQCDQLKRDAERQRESFEHQLQASRVLH